MNYNDVAKYLKSHLSSTRFAHSLLVAKEAKQLAELYHLDPTKAELVGLAHDVAKEFDRGTSLAWASKYHLPKHCLDESYSKLLHADLGALAAKELFAFTPEMCQAIKYHTLGHPDMTVFDKIIFLADKIGRSELSPALLEVRSLAYDGKIDQAMLAYLKHNQSLGFSAYPQTTALIQKLEQS